MNTDFPKDERSALESSLTALLLGELPHDQAAALHQKLAQDAELAKFYERLKQTINLVRETVASPAAQTADQPTPLKLSDERRQKLLQHFKTITPKQFAPPRRRRATSWLVPLGIAAALVALVAVTLLPNFAVRTRSSAQFYRTWSLPGSASRAPSPAAVPESSSDTLNPALLHPARSAAAIPSSPLASEAKSRAEVLAKIDSVTSAIVLPKNSEVADATTTTTSEGVKPWSETANLRGFYDDSLGRSGGQGGGGGFGGGGFGGRGGGSGGSGGGTSGEVSPTDGRQTGVAVANSALGNPEWIGAMQAGKRLGDVQQGWGFGAPSPPALAAPKTPSDASATETRVFRLANADASEAAKQVSQLIPERTTLNRGSLGNRAGDAGTTGQANGQVETLGMPPVVPDSRTSSLLVTAPKSSMPLIADTIAQLDSNKGRQESVAFYDLKNATPQDVQNNLQDLFQRNKVGAQNNDQDALLGQNLSTSTSGGMTGGAGRVGGAADGLEHGAPIAGVANEGDVLALNKPANTTVEKRIDRFGVTEPLITATGPAPATPPASPAPEPQGQTKLAWAGKSKPVSSSGYYGGGAYQEDAQSRPALRSPKEGGPAAGVGGVAMTPAPSGPQEAPANMESFRRRYALAGPSSAQKPAEDRTSAQGVTAPSAGFNFSTEAGQALIAEQKTEPPPTPSEPAAAAEHLVPLEIQLPAPAFKGTPREVPALGDVPAVGRFFRSKPELGSDAAATAGTPTAPAGTGEQGGIALHFAETTRPLDEHNRLVNPVPMSVLSAAQPPNQTTGAAESDGRAKDQVTAGAMQLKVEEKVKSVDLALKEDLGRQKSATAGDTLVHDGKLLYEMGKLDAADTKLKQALQEDPNNEAARYYLNLASEAKSSQAAKVREVTMRQDTRTAEQAWANPVKRELLPAPNPSARPPTTIVPSATDQLLTSGLRSGTNAVAVVASEPSTVEKFGNSGLVSHLGTDASGASRVAKSPIVLPSAQPETRLALNNSSSADQKPQLHFEANGRSPLMTAETLPKLEGLRIEKKAELVREQTLSERLKSLEAERGPEALAQAIPSAATDSRLNSLLEQERLAEQRLVTLEKSYGPANPDVLKSKAAAEDLHAQVKSRVDGILQSMDAKVAAEQEGLKNLEAEIDRVQKQDAEAAAKTQPYLAAKRDLEELQRSRQILDMKIASEKSDVELPKTTMVEVVDKAVPASSPSSTLWEKIRGKTGDYKSTARIKVERDQSDISGKTDHGAGAGYDPYFIQSEEEIIQSEAILGKVAEDLNLIEAWAGKKGAGDRLTTAETVQLLKKSLDVHSVQNTSLLEIGVKSDKPEEAARIANAVADEYKAHRLAERAQLTQGGIKALEELYAEQDKKVREAKKKVDDLGAKLQVPDGATRGQKADVTPPKPAAPAAIPQPEVQTTENVFSTFSLNVSDVSFKLAAASLEKGVMPEPATVRSEEFINAFDYRDPEPPPGVPVAFAWERAQYPFAQNRDLLRFSIKTAALGRQPGRPLNLVLLLDNSGSMERADRVRILQEALRVLAGQLQPQDKFSVVTFARTAHLWVDGVPGNNAGQAAEQVSGLTPQGGTNLEDAMNLAYQTALRHYLPTGVNRVVLLTDGAANLGNVEPEALKQKVEAHRKQGVALDCFGIGWEGYNDDLLEVLARNGDGRYAFLNSPEEVASEFAAKLAGALQVAASDVKVQVEFNAGRVTAYRQIGYAKHQLTKEQFRDNTVNAAQIGAAEAGNALYAVEVNPAGTGPLCTVRVRFRIPGTTDYREHAWDVPFTGNAVPLEQASSAMRLAATGCAFSEWLVSSPYAGEVTPDRLLGYLSGVPEVYGADARPKKLEWMIRQAKSIAGK